MNYTKKGRTAQIWGTDLLCILSLHVHVDVDNLRHRHGLSVGDVIHLDAVVSIRSMILQQSMVCFYIYLSCKFANALTYRTIAPDNTLEISPIYVI